VNSQRIIASLYVILFVGFGFGAGALLLDARAEYQQLKQAEAVNQRRLAEAQKRLQAQEKILDRLRHDPDYVEKVLRSRGYARPGDVIFRYPD
jgi:cell division protein DivIC